MVVGHIGSGVIGGIDRIWCSKSFLLQNNFHNGYGGVVYRFCCVVVGYVSLEKVSHISNKLLFCIGVSRVLKVC